MSSFISFISLARQRKRVGFSLFFVMRSEQEIEGKIEYLGACKVRWM